MPTARVCNDENYVDIILIIADRHDSRNERFLNEYMLQIFFMALVPHERFFSRKFESAAIFSAPTQEGNFLFLSVLSARKKAAFFPFQMELFVPYFGAHMA